ncbi:MAG: hypothetical protein GX622_07200 [Bacteroidales bacterium]|nr:hypothetical protein [Bacteroidales bacterium]
MKTMETRKFKLDTGEHDTITRVVKTLFGIICIAFAVVTAVIVYRSDRMSTGNVAAVVFLLLFGIWLVLAGFGLTERYVEISGDSVTLKDRFLVPARSLKPSDIKVIEFGQLKISFLLMSGEVLPLRLGTYYRENSFMLMEAVEEFCLLNNLATKGIKPKNDDQAYEGQDGNDRRR